MFFCLLISALPLQQAAPPHIVKSEWKGFEALRIACIEWVKDSSTILAINDVCRVAVIDRQGRFLHEKGIEHAQMVFVEDPDRLHIACYGRIKVVNSKLEKIDEYPSPNEFLKSFQPLSHDYLLATGLSNKGYVGKWVKHRMEIVTQFDNCKGLARSANRDVGVLVFSNAILQVSPGKMLDLSYKSVEVASPLHQASFYGANDIVIYAPKRILFSLTDGKSELLEIGCKVGSEISLMGCKHGIICIKSDGTIELTPVKPLGKARRLGQLDTMFVTAAAISPDQSTLALGTDDGFIVFVRLN